MTNKNLETILHCSPALIPVDYKAKADRTTNDFVRLFSFDVKVDHFVTDWMKLDRTIVYNRVCRRINHELHTNPDFNLMTYDSYMKLGTLFYSQEDIQTLASIYSTCSDTAFKYCMVFFAVYIHNFKKDYSFVVKKMEKEDVDQILLTAVHNVLLHYGTSDTNFSFHYLHQELQAALFSFAGAMLPETINRNEFGQYVKLISYINKYGVNRYNLEQFILEINATYEELSRDNRIFKLEAKDYEKGFKITLPKAVKLLSIYYAATNDNRLSEYTSDEEDENYSDPFGGTNDNRYSDVELEQLADLLFPQENLNRAFWHLVTSPNSTFTKEDFERYQITRYQLNKMIELLRNHLR